MVNKQSNFNRVSMIVVDLFSSLLSRKNLKTVKTDKQAVNKIVVKTIRPTGIMMNHEKCPHSVATDMMTLDVQCRRKKKTVSHSLANIKSLAYGLFGNGWQYIYL